VLIKALRGSWHSLKTLSFSELQPVTLNYKDWYKDLVYVLDDSELGRFANDHTNLRETPNASIVETYDDHKDPTLRLGLFLHGNDHGAGHIYVSYGDGFDLPDEQVYDKDENIFAKHLPGKATSTLEVDYWAASALVKEFATASQHRESAQMQVVVVDDEGEEDAENEGEEDEQDPHLAAAEPAEKEEEDQEAEVEDGFKEVSQIMTNSNDRVRRRRKIVSYKEASDNDDAAPAEEAVEDYDEYQEASDSPFAGDESPAEKPKKIKKRKKPASVQRTQHSNITRFHIYTHTHTHAHRNRLRLARPPRSHRRYSTYTPQSPTSHTHTHRHSHCRKIRRVPRSPRSPRRMRRPARRRAPEGSSTARPAT
jgi:hypothetical protein